MRAARLPTIGGEAPCTGDQGRGWEEGTLYNEVQVKQVSTCRGASLYGEVQCILGNDVMGHGIKILKQFEIIGLYVFFSQRKCTNLY